MAKPEWGDRAGRRGPHPYCAEPPRPRGGHRVEGAGAGIFLRNFQEPQSRSPCPPGPGMRRCAPATVARWNEPRLSEPSRHVRARVRRVWRQIRGRPWLARIPGRRQHGCRRVLRRLRAPRVRPGVTRSSRPGRLGGMWVRPGSAASPTTRSVGPRATAERRLGRQVAGRTQRQGSPSHCLLACRRRTATSMNVSPPTASTTNDRR